MTRVLHNTHPRGPGEQREINTIRAIDSERENMFDIKKAEIIK